MLHSNGYWLLMLGLVSLCSAGQPIPPAYQTIAEQYGIPPDTLYAIALTESGQSLAQKKAFRPWPWTLNVRGTPKRYATRLAAWQALNHYLEQGITLIDIGLMQVNWHYHHTLLETPWQALDPYHNIETAAKVLMAEFRQTKNWKQAVGRYHSPGRNDRQKKRATYYQSLVEKKLSGLLPSQLEPDS